MTTSERESRVTVRGQQIRVSIRPGTAPGPPLVLCNGIGAALDLVQPFVDALDPTIEIVRFDVPGVGGSPLPPTPYRFTGLAMRLGKLLDRLGYGAVDVLGISWGGGLAQQFALQNPRRCRRLVLVSTGTGMLMVPAHPRVLWQMLTPRRYRDRRTPSRSRPACTADGCAPSPNSPRECCIRTSRSASAADTPCNSRRDWDGPACRSCR